MGCSHCSEDATAKGEHMSLDLFDRALDCAARLEGEARAMMGYPFILLSGGEPTEHPDIEKIIAKVLGDGLTVMLLTNGMWLADEEKKRSILRKEWAYPRLLIQVTNDERFYPKKPPRCADQRIGAFVSSLSLMMPLGRFKGNMHDEVPMRRAPSCFNLRSFTKALGSIQRAISMLRLRGSAGLSGQCVPSISANGDLVVGETRFCYKVGTVDSSLREITEAVLGMKCHGCGLVNGLSQEQKRAIGESRLFAPGEPTHI